jgi:hypothetical protein
MKRKRLRCGAHAEAGQMLALSRSAFRRYGRTVGHDPGQRPAYDELHPVLTRPLIPHCAALCNRERFRSCVSWCIDTARSNASLVCSMHVCSISQSVCLGPVFARRGDASGPRPSWALPTCQPEDIRPPGPIGTDVLSALGWTGSPSFRAGAPGHDCITVFPGSKGRAIHSSDGTQGTLAQNGPAHRVWKDIQKTRPGTADARGIGGRAPSYHAQHRRGTAFTSSDCALHVSRVSFILHLTHDPCGVNSKLVENNSSVANEPVPCRQSLAPVAGRHARGSEQSGNGPSLLSPTNDTICLLVRPRADVARFHIQCPGSLMFSCAREQSACGARDRGICGIITWIRVDGYLAGKAGRVVRQPFYNHLPVCERTVCVRLL